MLYLYDFGHGQNQPSVKRGVRSSGFRVINVLLKVCGGSAGPQERQRG
jgi:hypothetical protein